MSAFNGFPSLPRPGEVAFCEINGVYCCADEKFGKISTFTNVTKNYPTINITRDHNYFRDDGISMYLEVEDNILKRITSVWYKQGFNEALNVAADPRINHDKPTLALVAGYLLKVVNSVTKLRLFFQPHLKDIGPKIIAKYSLCRNWFNSPVRALAWHPNCSKIAVTFADDYIRIYSCDSTFVSTLKCNSQSNVSSLAWRPYSASEIAVGCEVGVIVWSIDPSSAFTKPSSSNAVILKRSGHTPVTDVSWSPNGDILVSCSAADSAMVVWDVAMENGIALKRVAGGGVSFIKWCNDASHLFSASTSFIFRVWDTQNNWKVERWCANNSIRCACWGPRNTLLFAADGEPVIYALYINLNVYSDDKSTTMKAQPVLNVTKSELSSEMTVGGPILDLVWSKSGNHLAIMFVESPVIAVFNTTLTPTHLQITPCCFVTGTKNEIPNVIRFQDNFENGSCLTIAWSTGRIQYFPIIYINN